jgi:hypothetical protein
MLTRLRHLRPALFEEMRRDALNSALRPPTFYIERARLDHHMQVETLVGSGLLVFLMLCAWFTVANLHWAVVKASLGFGVLASWGMLTSQQKAHQWERILGALCDRDAEAATTAIERLNLWTDSHAPISVRIDRWILSRIYR